jgi:hypothetical protein
MDGFGRRSNFTLNPHGNEAKNALGGLMAQAPKCGIRVSGNMELGSAWKRNERPRSM